MKFILIATLALASLSSLANVDKTHNEMMKKMDKMSFEEAKKWKEEMITQKKSMISEEETCVENAKDKAGLQRCTDNMNVKMHNMMNTKKI